MGVIKFLRDVTGLFNWSTDENPTTQQDYQNAVKNWQETERNLVDISLWQPETNYAVDDIVQTPALSSGLALICTISGQSGTTEQIYTGVSVGSTVTDGTVTWTVVQLVTSAGGTMTGNIVLSNGAMVSNYNNTTAMRFVGGDATNGYTGKPRIALFGNNYSSSSLAGGFAIVADDSTNNCILNGYPNGDLKWNSKEVERVQASGTNYIRFVSGLQICWGSGATENPPASVNFPVPFNANPGITMTHISTVSTGGNYTKLANISSTAFTPILTSGSSYVATSYRYVAVGTWK